jgi:hypothetical protein
MGNKQEVAEGRPAARGGPPWADAPEVAAPGAQVPAPDGEAVPEVRAGRHRRARRKAGGGRHNSR